MNRRYGEIMAAGVLLLVSASGFLSGDPSVFSVFAGLGGIYFVAKQFQVSRDNLDREREADLEYERWRQQRSGRSEFDFEHMSDQVDRRPQTNAERVYSHALAAAQAAGLDATEAVVLPVDIGLFGYQGDTEPQLYRAKDIPNDVDYIQPFVQLRIPHRAKGKITFEVLDDHGQTVFLRTEEHDLKRGRNLIMPARRIPVHDALEMDEGGWTLKVSAENELLAVHVFDWREPNENFVADKLEDDGEISNELRAAMAESRLENMSLDELLAFQDEPAQKSANS